MDIATAIQPLTTFWRGRGDSARGSGRLVQELHVQFGEVLEDTVKAKRRRRLQEGVVAAGITHLAEERLVQAGRVELDEPGIVAGQLKGVRRAGGHVQKIARVQRYHLFAGCHAHASVQAEEGFRALEMYVIRDAMSLWAPRSSGRGTCRRSGGDR